MLCDADMLEFVVYDVCCSPCPHAWLCVEAAVLICHLALVKKTLDLS